MNKKLLFIIGVVSVILCSVIVRHFHKHTFVDDYGNRVAEDVITPGMILSARNSLNLSGTCTQWVNKDNTAIINLYHDDYSDKVLKVSTAMVVDRVYKDDYKPIGDKLYAVNEFMCDVHTEDGYKFVLTFNTGKDIKPANGKYSGGNKTRPLVGDLDKMVTISRSTPPKLGKPI